MKSDFLEERKSTDNQIHSELFSLEKIKFRLLTLCWSPEHDIFYKQPLSKQNFVPQSCLKLHAFINRLKIKRTNTHLASITSNLQQNHRNNSQKASFCVLKYSLIEFIVITFSIHTFAFSPLDRFDYIDYRKCSWNKLFMSNDFH